MEMTQRSVEVQGIRNTVDFERVMNQFTSSFTENYIRGGKYGKVKGFDIYCGKNKPLKPFQRKKIFVKSEVYFNEVENKMKLKTINTFGTLDSKWRDEEVIDYWNSFYDSYGYLINDFKDKWEREFLPKTPEIKSDSTNENSESLNSKILQFLKKPKLLKGFD